MESYASPSNYNLAYSIQGHKYNVNILHKILSCVQGTNNDSWEDHNFDFPDFYEFKFSATMSHYTCKFLTNLDLIFAPLYAIVQVFLTLYRLKQ